MSELTVNPEIPYVGNIPAGKLEPGKMCRIQGVTLPQIDRFTINFQTGPNAKPRDDTGLHMSVRIGQGYIARNSYVNGEWGDEDGTGQLTIGPAQTFEILILTDVRDYKVAVNGKHFCEFPHRIPFEKISNLLIDGDVNITLVSWELSVPVAPNQPVSEPSSLNTNTSQQFNAGQYFPPNNYQPQGPYNAPGQYIPPAPPGAPPQAESAFGNILEQAQEALVGAIKSGAAEKLLSGLLSTGEKQGYTPQNAQYGIYPQLPPDGNFTKSDPQNLQNSQTRGPLETFLSGLLSNPSNTDQTNQTAYTRPDQPTNLYYNNQGPADTGPQSYGQYPAGPPPPQQQQQQSKGPLENILSGLIPSGTNQQVNNPPHQPNIPQMGGGEGSFGGLGSMGGLLSNLAGQILHNPKGNN